MINSSLIIRTATIDDIASLVELGGTTFRETYELSEDPAEMDEYVTREFTPKTFLEILSDAQSSLLVALAGERFVGYAHLVASPAPPCVTGDAPIELKRLYFRKDAIGKGYGAKLMQQSFQVARRHEHKTMWLVVYSINHHARAFYSRFGFVDVGIKDFYFGGRAYPDPVMARGIG